ncbi:MAG: hypothetical protein IJA12_06980, partial [Oscillospiraceae bacterium]|nr:hypothetical protein [Oscillospiraceae bacterium]
DYWKDELKEYKKINLELAGKGVSASAEDQFMQFETKKLNKIARKFKTSQFNVMLFVYHIILSDLLKTNDTIVGFSCANRLNKEFYKTIGYLSRAVQHRMIINDTDKLSDLLEISKVKCNENLANQQTSHYNDNSQFYISFQNFISKKKQEESILVPIKIPVKRVLDFFTMIVFEKSDELTLMLNGDEDIFSSDFINSLKKYLYVVVDMLYENPEASVANVRNAYQETCK